MPFLPPNQQRQSTAKCLELKLIMRAVDEQCVEIACGIECSG